MLVVRWGTSGDWTARRTPYCLDQLPKAPNLQGVEVEKSGEYGLGARFGSRVIRNIDDGGEFDDTLRGRETIYVFRHDKPPLGCSMPSLARGGNASLFKIARFGK